MRRGSNRWLGWERITQNIRTYDRSKMAAGAFGRYRDYGTPPFRMYSVHLVRVQLIIFRLIPFCLFVCLFIYFQGLDGKIQNFIEWLMSQPVREYKETDGFPKEALSVLMLCAASNRRRPFSNHTKMADF